MCGILRKLINKNIMKAKILSLELVGNVFEK
jgi:hypothetical protein